ncbi:MAG: CDP-glucose 4,6-dehydratase [Conexivisphaerales archaeon]
MEPHIKSNFYKGKKIMIIGHTGFVGSWLTKIASILGAEIAGYALDPPTTPNMYSTLNLKGVLDKRGDIRNKESLERAIKDFQPEIIFHLAAQPIVLESFENPVETLEINVIGTANVLDSMRKVDSIKVALIMTSDKVYRNNEWPYPYREIDPLGGRDPYSASKSCQDIVVNSFRESFFKPSGVKISTVRAGNIIGGGDWGKYRLIPDIVKGIVSGKTIEIRNPESIRPWQYILDIIDGMLLLTKKSYDNEKFSGDWNFGPLIDTNISVRELTQKFISAWGEGGFNIRNAPSNKEAGYLKLDISKSRHELNWIPKYDIETAVDETVRWYKSYYKGVDMDKVTSDQIYKYQFDLVETDGDR